MSKYRRQGRVDKSLKQKLILSTIILVFFAAILMTNAIADDPGTENTTGEGISSVEEEPSPEAVRLNALKDRLKQSEYYSDELFGWSEENKPKFEEFYLTYTEAILELEEGLGIDLINEFLITITDFKKVSEEDMTVFNETSVPSYGNVDMAGALAAFNRKMEERFSDDEQLLETLEPENLDEVLKTGGLISKEVPGLEMSYKNVTPTEKFRHYEVELAVKAVGPIIDPDSLKTGEDIVLAIDKSASMAGLVDGDETHGTKLESVKSSAKWFVLNAFLKNPDNRIGIVTFSDESETVCELMGIEQKDEILKRIDLITAEGETNTQAGLLQAKKVLEITDGIDVREAPREKSLMIFSDGTPTAHYTDNNTDVSETSFIGYPEKDKKRWGYGGYENTVIVKSAYDEEPRANKAEISKRLALLEAQYAVRQGLNIYTVDFSGGNTELTEFFKLMTYSLTQSPENVPEGHLYPKSFNKSRGVSVIDEGFDGRYFIVDTAEGLEAAFETVLGTVEDQKYNFEVTDSLDLENFEIVDYPKASHKGDSVKVENSFIHWQITGNTNSLRTVTYIVRVVDKPIFEKGTGIFSPGGDFSGNPDFNLKVEVGNRTTLSYKDKKDGTQTYPYMIPTVSVQPLISGEAFSQNARGDAAEVFLLGDNAFVGGKILSGSGSFAYQWYNGDEPLNDAPMITDDLDEKNLVYPLEVETEIYKTPKLTEKGESSFTLRLIDRKAESAGYLSEKVAYVEVPVTFTALENNITVEIIGETGGFETTIHKFLENKEESHEKWFLSGTSSQTYENVGSGIFKVQTYVPYGYTVTIENSDGVSIDGGVATFQVKPVQDAKGNWSVASPKVTIKISKVKNALNFFDWSWGTNESLVDN